MWLYIVHGNANCMINMMNHASGSRDNKWFIIGIAQNLVKILIERTQKYLMKFQTTFVSFKLSSGLFGLAMSPGSASHRPKHAQRA